MDPNGLIIVNLLNTLFIYTYEYTLPLQYLQIPLMKRHEDPLKRLEASQKSINYD